MFDIPDEEILETHEEPTRGEDGVVASLTYNQSERDLISDSVDHIEVIPIDDAGESGDDADEERYRIDDTGYLVGSLVVTREGLEAFGISKLRDQTAVPYWLLSVTNRGTRPWWVPNSYDAPAPMTCAKCRASVHVSEVITLGDRDEAAGYRCESCWREER